MSWTAHYFDPRLNRDAVTRAFGSKDAAQRRGAKLGSRARARGLARRDARPFDHSSMSQTASLA